MKNTTKILALVLVVMTVLMSLTIVAGAEGNTNVAINISNLENANPTTAGELVEGSGVFVTGDLKINENGKSADGFTFTKRLQLGGTMKVSNGVVSKGVKIVTTDAATIVVYAISGDSNDYTRTLQLATIGGDGKFSQVAVTAGIDAKNATKYELAAPSAGEYYLGSTNSGINLYYIAVEYASAPAQINKLEVGDNTVVVTGDTLNAAQAPVEWYEFEVTEKAHYKFTGTTFAFIYSRIDETFMDYTACVCGFKGEADLEPGTYYILVGGVNTGEFTITATKTAIETEEPGEGGEEEPPVVTEDPKFSLGDNAVVIDGSQTNLTGNAIAWYTFTPEVAGTYTFACSDLTVYILTQKDMSKIDYYIGAGGVADLEAGKTYYILVGKNGVKGEFTVNVSVGGEVGHKNTFVVGDNHYIITDALAEVGYEFITIEIAQPGTYVITGGAPMKVYMWTILGAMDDRNFGWNVDAEYASGFAPAFVVTLPEAGTYYIGTNYEFVGDLREFDINISLHTEHSFNEEGECICGEKAPEVPELTIWQKIVLFIKKIIFRLLALLPKRG